MNFLYLHSERIGYGYHGIATAKALSDLGVDVYDGLPGSGDINLGSKRSKVCKDVLYLTIPTHITGWWEGQRTHLFTMWEATELPESMRETLHNFDTILTPSLACLDLYSQYHPNVHFVPLGVDSERWKLTPRRTHDIFFNFLIGGSGKRKGNDLVHKAFLELFGPHFDPGNKPIPRLLMKNPKAEPYGGENVEVISGYMPAEDEVALYETAHCYVQPSRGEGWGMQPLQAMAQGIPTILTDAHGHSAFAHHGIPISATTTPADYMSLFGDAGTWWEPNYDELKAAMWDVYANYSRHLTRAVNKASVVAREFTWEKSARRIVDILGEDKLNERFRPDEIPTKWYTPDQKLYRVVTLRDWKADIGGVTHLLKRGVEYWKTADTKRVLFEGGVLDPICLKDPDGLSPHQLERLGVYLEAHNQCPTCGSDMNRQETEDAIC
jgi:glycosyltransferase involved in cell wall biosynthesis